MTAKKQTGVLSKPKFSAHIWMSIAFKFQVLVEYRNKDPNHVEWGKSLKELYLPGLRDYVKAFYPLGLVWGPAGGTVPSAPASAPASSPSAAKGPFGKNPSPPPPPPPASALFSSEAAPSRPKQGLSAVFQEISSKPVTAGK